MQKCLILQFSATYFTGAIDVALGSAVTGVYATSTDTFNVLQKVGCFLNSYF